MLIKDENHILEWPTLIDFWMSDIEALVIGLGYFSKEIQRNSTWISNQPSDESFDWLSQLFHNLILFWKLMFKSQEVVAEDETEYYENGSDSDEKANEMVGVERKISREVFSYWGGEENL